MDKKTESQTTRFAFFIVGLAVGWLMLGIVQAQPTRMVGTRNIKTGVQGFVRLCDQSEPGWSGVMGWIVDPDRDDPSIGIICTRGWNTRQ